MTGSTSPPSDVSPGGVPSPSPTVGPSESNSPTAFQFPPGFLRRTHKKSRTGCAVCKKRKIKCDERKGGCLNCILHGVDCPFKLQPAAARASVSSPSPAARTDAKPKDLPFLELELLHNFTTETYLTLAGNPRVENFWRITVVQSALQCDYAMRAILAVSALHLAHTRPDKRDFYTFQGITYHQQAARSAMELMKDPQGGHSRSNLFIFSMLTIYFALGSPRSSNGYFFTDDSSFPDWAFLMRGSKLLASEISEHDKGPDTPLEDFLAYGLQRWNARPSKDPTKADAFGELKQRVLAAVQDEKLRATYTSAIEELEICVLSAQDDTYPRDIIEAMMWLWAVSDDLIPLLKVPSQEAVAIFAHFCILLKQYEDQWWLRGWSEYLISRSYGILDQEHRSWIEWPMREMGYDASTLMSPN